MKTSAYFADCSDVQLAATAGVTYADMAAVIAAVASAGFVEWRVMDPAARAARPQ